ncbi:MAG: protein kinase, partial [Thermoanaerobaculia bacterium]|nr:protein kinase [Thermoanaerobaculia bacterium]
FGIAKRQAADAQATLSLSDDDLTRDGEMVGTAAYMSPEQLRGGVVDERSDLFSFGAVLYEMLAGRPAFASSGWSGFVARVLGRPADLDELDAKVAPVALKRVLQRCLQVDPVQRWPSASDLLRELEACRDGGSGRPAPAAAPTAAPATPRPARPSAAEDSTAADSGAISAPGAVVRLAQAGLVAVAFLLSGLTLYVINPSVHDAFLYPLLALSGALPIAMAMAAIWDVDLRTGASGLIRGLGSFLGGAASPPDRGWRRAIGIAVLIYLATTVGYVGGHVADAVLPRLTLLQHPRKPAADWSIENPDEDWKTYRAAYKAAFLSTFAASESDFQTHKYELGRGSVRGARTMIVFATILVAAGVVDLVRGRRRRGALALASGMVACLLLYSLWYEGESGYVQDMVSASARLPAPSRPAVPASAPEILRRLEPAGSVR